jgi:hypothetical protein
MLVEPFALENRNGGKKFKVILVTGRGILYDCGVLSIPHCLYNRLTDGDKFVSPTHLRALLSRNIIILLVVLISFRG